MSLLNELLETLAIGPAKTRAGLAMFPLLGPSLAEPDYLTLDEALAAGARVTEREHGPEVNRLRLENPTGRAVLLMDGEELIGAMQNRVLNTTILAPADRSLDLPVSCVEEGRWRARSAAFASSDRVHHARGRGVKMRDVGDSLSRGRGHGSDQGAVWREVQVLFQSAAVASDTQAMSDVYESRRPTVDAHVADLEPVSGQTGAAFTVDGEIVGLDLFDCEATLRRLLPKLVRSYAVDTLSRSDGRADTAPDAASAFVAALARCSVETHPSPGEGEDHRLTGPGLVGSALLARGRVVHLGAFRPEPVAGRRPEREARLAGPSTRRRFGAR